MVTLGWKTKLIVMFISIVVVGVAGVAFLAYQNRSDQKLKPIQTVDPSQPMKASVVPPATKHKLACDLVSKELITQLIGASAVNNDKVLALVSRDYSFTTCEYVADNNKINLILYMYPSKALAKAGKDEAQNRHVVLDEDGASTLQPRQSVAGIDGAYVVSAAVTKDGVFDANNSKTLLDEALKRL